MRFAQIEMFHLLWIVLAFVFFLRFAAKRRERTIHRFTERNLVEKILDRFDIKKYRQRNILLILSLVLSVVALARPQWGFQWQEIKRQGLDILVVVDTSKSMLTRDVKPNRLERTKLAVFDLIKKLKGDRIGLIAFSGDAFLLCPLTTDYSGFLLSVNDVDTKSIPRGGTNISRAIEEALGAYKNIPSQYKAVVIITDGENLQGDPIKVARLAKEKGIKIYCIGIGTKDGELIQIENESGELEFLKDDQGNFVKSRLNEDLLEQIALITKGIYIKSSGAEFGLDLIYEKELSKLERREIKSQREKRYFERFQIPLALALIFLIGSTVIETRK